MNDAELAAMEGIERRAVEARIKTLRNIQSLLDAAMLQFQQYLASISSSGVNLNQTTETPLNGENISFPNDAGHCNKPSSSKNDEKIEETSQLKEEKTAMPEALNQNL